MTNILPSTESIPNAVNHVQNITPSIDTIPTPTALNGTPKKRNYLPWLLGILGLIVVLVAILLVYVGKSKSTLPGLSTQTPVPLEQNTIDTTNIDMSSWKTYINRVRGFEFKYPNNLEIYSDMGMDYSDDSIYLYSKSNKFPYCGVQSISKKFAAEEEHLGNMKADSLKELIDNSYKQAIENQYTLKRIIQPVQEGIFSGKKMYKYVVEEEGVDMIWGSGIEERSIYTILALEHNDSYIMIGCGDNNIYSQILSTFKFSQTNDSEVIVPNVIEQLIPQVKWGALETVSNYPADLGLTVSGLQRTGIITNPDVEAGPYNSVDELLKDKNSLINLGWSKADPIGASGPFLTINTYYKTINGISKKLEFYIEDIDHNSTTNVDDLNLVKCPCVNKITVFQQQ